MPNRPTTISPHYQTFGARYDAGKARRRFVSRESLGEFSALERDPLAILTRSDERRLPSLLPIRYERMAGSRFAFLRGAAAIMANDLAGAAVPALTTQSCGDCHLMNFGALVSPEGHVLFDINDFDESLPSVDFTVDLKRLCASFAVAALDAGRSEKRARRVAQLAAEAYRKHMRRLSRLSPIEAWQDRTDLVREADAFGADLADKLRALVAKSRPDREDANFPHMTRSPQDGWRIEDEPPLIYHIDNSPDPAAHVDVARIFENCRETLRPEVASLLRRYRLDDTVFKVVGVGSVGTFCAIGLYTTADDEPLFLQLKEASASVLERVGPGLGAEWSAEQGKRVVYGQRIMQAASDIFLGWTRDDASGRQFYVRHLKNRRLGSVAELIEENALADYARLCGRVLARAHARSADPAIICGYMGKSEAFDDALASFAMLYAAQNKQDYERFVAARNAPSSAQGAAPAAPSPRSRGEGEDEGPGASSAAPETLRLSP